MKIKKNDVINSILEVLSSQVSIPVDVIPNIDLYMDQVTSFMETNLASQKRYEEDKILTKTMINNYVKDGILPAPEKKKYSREHLLVLMGIYYLKDILSIKDVGCIIKPLTEKYFHTEDGLSITTIYETFRRMGTEHLDHMRDGLLNDYTFSSFQFSDVPEEEQETLRNLTFIGLLAIDVYMKKQMIETMIDDIIKTN